MLKKIMLTTAVCGLMISGAAAQQSNMGAGAAPKFITAQSPDQWVFSKFKGTDVLGVDNAHIGDVSDLLFEKSGKIVAVVVGVGGFLGIGEKNVAIDMSAFQVVPASTGSSTTASNDPTNVKLKVSWTKEQLKEAPDFQYYKAPSGTSSTGAPTTGQRTNGMSPAAPAPAPAPAPRQ
jgi:hypothetical protein